MKRVFADLMPAICVWAGYAYGVFMGWLYWGKKEDRG